MNDSIRFYTEYLEKVMESSPIFRTLLERISEKEIVDYELVVAAEKEVRAFNRKNHYDVFMISGTSRCCIISNNCNYVLKFSWDSLQGTDSCKTELEVYEKAYSRGLADFFAKPYKIGSIKNNFFNTCDFYLMEKAEVDEDRIEKYCSGSYYDKFYTALENERRELDDIMEVFEGYDTVGVFIEYYISQLERLEDFVDFINFIGLVDLHDQNVGFIGDRPVIIDYALITKKFE